ncbi:MAG TPA: VOC family protein [Candidatus Acidoferrum sp.]|nr:VOC family protein [Candidatus Acidoferrum sp.]
MAKLDHVSLAVRNWRVSRDWHTRLLGLKLEFEVPHGGAAGLGVAALQDDAGLTLFLEQVPDTVPVCGCIHTFQVQDVEAMHAKLSASGIQFLKPPQKLFWGYGAEIADPDGHVIRLWDEKSMREKGGS